MDFSFFTIEIKNEKKLQFYLNHFMRNQFMKSFVRFKFCLVEVGLVWMSLVRFGFDEFCLV